ncbi:MAG: type II secretion system GspH family protein [Planctomycetes bacterium]|nr:type II secretion system GspH family protein [Planctomycetota bacterium]
MTFQNIRTNKGFTLVELLVAMAILSMVTVSLFSLLFQAQNIANAAQNRINLYGGVSNVFDRIERDINGMMPMESADALFAIQNAGAMVDDSNSDWFLKMNTKTEVLGSGSPPTTYVLPCEVRYYLARGLRNGPVVMRQIRDINLGGAFPNGDSPLDGATSQAEVAAFVQEVKVEYLKRDPTKTLDAGHPQLYVTAGYNGVPELNEWDNTDTDPPLAVRVTMVFTDEVGLVGSEYPPSIIRVLSRIFYVHASTVAISS